MRIGRSDLEETGVALPERTGNADATAAVVLSRPGFSGPYGDEAAKRTGEPCCQRWEGR
jgi:hypothetical protein